MKKFWQTDWFDIKFDSFSKLDSKNQANEEFYEKFYQEFFKKFNSYEELPEQWKKDKRVLADFIVDKAKNYKKGLSIGCGSGFIENEILNKWGGELMAIEPSKTASKWISVNQKIKFINGYFPQALSKDEKFDFAYMCFIDYIFDNKSYIELIKDVKNYPIDDFYLVGISTYEPKLIPTIKYYIKHLLIPFGFFKQQLWGYLRTIDEHIDNFKKAGYKNIEYGKLENNIYWIRAKND